MTDVGALVYKAESWISAAEAVDLLSGSGKPFDGAIERFLSSLINNTLVCRAEMVAREADVGPVDWDCLDWGDVHKARRQNPRSFVKHESMQDHQFLLVPADFMSVRDGWAIDPTFTSWTDGRFVAKRMESLTPVLPLKRLAILGDQDANRSNTEETSTKIGMRHIVSGLRVQRSQIQVIAGIPAATPTPQGGEHNMGSPSPGSNAGRKRSPLWEEWTAELVAMIFEEGLPPKLTNGTVYDAVRDRLAERGLLPPSDEATRRTIAAVIARLGELSRTK